MSEIVPTCREDVTKRIQQQKVALQKNWRDLATQLNQSVEWYLIDCLHFFFSLTLSLFRSVAQLFALVYELLNTTWKAISIPMQWLKRDWYTAHTRKFTADFFFNFSNKKSQSVSLYVCVWEWREEKSNFNYEMRTENSNRSIKNAKVSLIKMKSIFSFASALKLLQT